MNFKKSTPPRLFLRFFRWFCHPELKKYVEGDLMELYDERLKEFGKRKADIKFIIDVLLLFRPGIIRPAEGYQNLNNYGMFKNYFKVGIRNILKYKMFSFINVFGLAVAMSVCMLIMLMLADQKSYDQFHVKKERIYRILSDRENSKAPNAITALPLAGALKTDYPIIEESTQLIKGVGGDITYNGTTVEARGYFADASFFNVFSYELEKGNMNGALTAPNSIVITKEFSRQLFNDENPIGKTVELADRGFAILGESEGSSSTSWESYTVTGVFAARGFKSHLKFDVLVSAASRKILYEEHKIADLTGNWDQSECYTYVVLNEEKNINGLTASLNDLVTRKYARPETPKGFRLIGQKLTEITPGILVGNESSHSLPRIAYYFLSFLALVIMISACLNYTNLSTARALSRAKEIGIRKVTGAYRKNLVFQFLSESILTALLALFMAMVLLVILKPAFKGLWINRQLNFDLQANFFIYFVFAGFALLIGVLAGIYPAMHLSKYQPIKALKNSDSMRGGKFGMRKVLSVSQFVISLFFITTSILIYNQFKYFLEFEYGFSAANIVNVPLQGNDYQKISTELGSVSGVSTISASDIIPATGTNNGIGLRAAGSADEYERFSILLTDENFIINLGIPLIAGKNLPISGQSSGRFILINESAVKRLGYKDPSEIIGKTFEADWNRGIVEVIGVVKDFRFRGPHETDAIDPLMLRNQPGSFSYVNVKIASRDVIGTVTELGRKWKTIDPVHPFKYEFFDDQLVATHRIIFDIVSILGFIAFLAIVIACLGLLGMATYTAERRRKEVGIRKVLGAEDFAIALLLSKAFLKMLIISVCIGAPLSYMVNNLWLEKFPNRVDFGFGTVFLGTLILLVFGLITIGSQTIRASKTNPVETLKMD